MKKTLFLLLVCLFFTSCLKKKMQDRIAYLEKEGRLPEAIEEYKKKTVKNPSDPRLHFELAALYDKTGDSNRAMLEYNATVLFDKSYEARVNEKKAEILIRQGKLEAEKGNMSGALSNFESALVHDQTKTKLVEGQIMGIYAKSAGENFEKKKFDEAMADFSKILKYDPKNEEALTGQVNCLIGQKKFNEAKLEIEKLKSIGISTMDGALSDLKVKLGDQAFTAGEPGKAKAFYDEAVGLKPEIAETLKPKYTEMEFAGLKKMIESGDYDNALLKLSELRGDKKDSKYDQMEADIYEKAKKTDLLIPKYEELLAASPQNKNNYKKLIKLYQDTGSPAEEMRVKRKQAETFGVKESRELCEEIAKFDFSKGAQKESAAMYTKLSESFPKEARYLYELTMVYSKMKDNKTAKTMLEKAMTLDPKMAGNYEKKYDVSFKLYVKKGYYIKLAGISGGALLALFTVIKFLSRRKEKLAYQGT